jgi:uncharacterized protein (TIGR02186 family)
VIARALLAAVALVAAAGTAEAERLTIASSTTQIDISASFAGMPITVFGVIERDGPTAELPLDADYRVAVLILGPRTSVVARKKDRVLGIWANAQSQTIINPPSVYLLSTSVDLPRLASPSARERLQVGFDNIAFAYQGRATINDPGAAEFRDAFIRLKEQARLYNETGSVGFIGNLVFRTTARLPASIPVGDYTVVAYLFSGDELVARAEEKIAVSKTGFEATMAAFARTQSLPYGILVVAMALVVGWLGGVIFRRD